MCDKAMTKEIKDTKETLNISGRVLSSRDEISHRVPLYTPTTQISTLDLVDGLRELESGLLRCILDLDAEYDGDRIFHLNLAYTAYLVRLLVQHSARYAPLHLELAAFDDELTLRADLGDVCLSEQILVTLCAAATVAGFAVEQSGNSFTFTATALHTESVPIYARHGNDFRRALSMTFIP